MTIEVLDPTYEHDGAPFALAPRLATLDGSTIAVVSNGKKNTQPFFDALERELCDRYGVSRVVRRTKANYSAPAEAAALADAGQWHALIAGVGD